MDHVALAVCCSLQNELQGGPKKIQLKTIDYFVVNSNFCEPPCIDLLDIYNLTSPVISNNEDFQFRSLNSQQPKSYFSARSCIEFEKKFVKIIQVHVYVNPSAVSPLGTIETRSLKNECYQFIGTYDS